MSEPQKITTEIILADFIPAPARTPELAREIEAAIRADNEVALTRIIQMTHTALAAQQNQIDQIANFQQAQSNELSQIRQEIRGLSQSQPQQPQIIYNISDNRSLTYNQTSNYRNCWNSYDDHSDHSDNSTDTCNNSGGGFAWLLIPGFLIFATWMCPGPNSNSQQQTPQQIQRAR